MATAVPFQTRLQQSNPEAYNKIKNLAQYTANENFGGQIQDYQVQLFTPLDTKSTGIPKQLEFTTPSGPITAIDDSGNPYTYTPQPQIKTPGVYAVSGEEGGVSGYSSEKPTYVNGVPVFASYDTSGKLTGYQGDPRVVTWLNGNSYAYGSWDANGNHNQKQPEVVVVDFSVVYLADYPT